MMRRASNKTKHDQREVVTATLLNEDCRSFLKRVPTSSIDLVLTDPPYEISRKTGFESVKHGIDRFAVSMDFGEWDKDFEGLDKILDDCFRVLKPSGSIVIFYDLWKITTLSDSLKRAGFHQLRFLEWIKSNPVPLNSKTNYLTNSREIALCAVKKSKPTFNSSYDNGIYQFPICHEKGRFHPTQKPLALIEELVQKHSNEGDTVLDCFSGSGTTAVAAIRHPRNFMGCELDEDYYNKSITRLESEASRSVLIKRDGI